MAALMRAGKAAGIMLGLAGMAGVAALGALRRPLPRVSGTFALPGLRAPVQVIRDRWGVPHIYGHDRDDLFMAQGYVHAQDRLWQMEYHRRTGHGQLAEMFGPVALEVDRFVRVLGFGRVARREAELLDGEERAMIAAYVHGVNTYIERHARRLPIEFTLLRLRPRLWEPADVLVWSKVMALNLSENWAAEALRARIVAAVGAERAAMLESGYPSTHPLTIPRGVQYRADIGADVLRAASAASPFVGGAGGQGSNAWVVGGARTSSGKPLLANDPHLALRMPALWYENHLCGDDYHVTGASIPGSPGVIIGHNERIAWGVTNGMNDVQDLYIEKFDSADPTRYEFQGQWERADVVREEIVVRGASAPVVEEVRITRHGPVISSLISGETQALAMRWTALDPARITKSILALNRAGDWESFSAALADWSVPPQNFVYADVDGHFGYRLGGDIPIRRQGDGRLPVPGWTGEYEWSGLIPQAEMPHALDPDEGFAVTANNRIIGDEYPYPLPAEWFSGYRATRIRQLIEQTSKHDATSFARIHGDQRSLPGLELAALIGRVPVLSVTAQHARDALAGWDGDLTAESVAGTIYARLREKLLFSAYAEVSGPFGTVIGLGLLAMWPRSSYLNRALVQILNYANTRNDAWLPSGRSWDTVLAEAWDATIAELRAEYGDDVRLWRYGRTHTLLLRHPLGVVRLLAPLFNRGPLPTGGDIDTVCMGYLPRSFAGAPFYVGPSYRHICDTAEWDRSLSIYPGGQSGQPGSRHYDDFLRPWFSIQYHPMLWSRAHVEEAARSRMTLAPNAA